MNNNPNEGFHQLSNNKSKDLKFGTRSMKGSYTSKQIKNEVNK